MSPEIQEIIQRRNVHSENIEALNPSFERHNGHFHMESVRAGHANVQECTVAKEVKHILDEGRCELCVHHDLASRREKVAVRLLRRLHCCMEHLPCQTNTTCHPVKPCSRHGHPGLIPALPATSGTGGIFPNMLTRTPIV